MFNIKSAVGSTLLCISNHLSYEQLDLQLESTFIEISNPKKTNVTVGCTYRHPHMDLNEFNDYYVNNLLDNLRKIKLFFFLYVPASYCTTSKNKE